MGVGRYGVCPTELKNFKLGSTLHIVFTFTKTIPIEFALFLPVKESSDSLFRSEH